jgi:hypothetical protein
MAVKFYRTGEYVSDVITDVIQLWGKISASGNVTHFRAPFSTAGYQVTAGKTLYIVKMRPIGENNPTWIKLGYADNDVGLDTTTARTNPVMAIGVDGTAKDGWYTDIPNGSGLGDLAVPGFGMLWKLAIATKFPFARALPTIDGQGIQLWCVEV